MRIFIQDFPNANHQVDNTDNKNNTNNVRITISVDVPDNSTYQNLQDHIKNTHGIPHRLYYLMYNGKPLEETRTLKSYTITDNSFLRFFIRNI